jgi:hypothetical protein
VKPANLTPEQVWKSYVIKVAEHQAHQEATKVMRNLRCRVFVNQPKEQKK